MRIVHTYLAYEKYPYTKPTTPLLLYGKRGVVLSIGILKNLRLSLEAEIQIAAHRR